MLLLPLSFVLVAAPLPTAGEVGRGVILQQLHETFTTDAAACTAPAATSTTTTTTAVARR